MKTPEMSDQEAINKIFNIIQKSGNVFGCRLLCDDDLKRSSKCEYYLRKLAFGCIIVFYTIGLAAIALTIVPLAGDGGNKFEFNFSTAFPIMWLFIYIDGLASFVCLNHSNIILNRKDGFFDQYRENFSNTKLYPRALKIWIWVTKGVLYFECISYAGSVALGGCYIAGILPQAFPVDIDRVSKRLSIPPVAVRSIFQVIKTIVIPHIAYHNLILSSLCEFARAYVSTYCWKLSRESAGTFTVRRLGRYQRDFGRLAELVSCLDDAFKHSCFCQLALFTGTMCLIGFIFIKGDLEIVTVFVILFASLLIVGTFLHTGVPAMLLKAEVR